MQLNYCT